MAFTTITTDNFQKEVLEAKIPVLLDFWAEQCDPCKMIAPIIEEISHQVPTIKVCKVNVDEEATLAMKFGITAIPTIVFLNHGQVVQKSIGYCSKEDLLKLIEAIK